MKYHISIHKSLLLELFPTLSFEHEPLFSIFTQKPVTIKGEENILAMIREINKVESFPEGSIENRGLLNIFNNTKATAEQSHDMLHFREIGSSDLDNYINHNILKKQVLLLQ